MTASLRRLGGEYPTSGSNYPHPPHQPTTQAYQLSLQLVSRIAVFLSDRYPHNAGGSHFCDRSGRVLLHLDQVVRAILDGGLNEASCQAIQHQEDN